MGDLVIPHSKPTIGLEEERAVVEVLRSKEIAQGRKVEEFEQKFAAYIRMTYGVATSSGLAALHLALISLEVKEGDEVILPSYVCEALLDAVLYLQARPIIVDVELETGNISAYCIKKNITPRTKAIIVPHMFGFPASLGDIIDLGIPVVEDCAHSIGALYQNKKLGSFGKISVFSFYATKMLSTGEGGMIVTNEFDIAEKVRDLKAYGGKSEFIIRYNYKMTDIGAAMGLIQLSELESFINKRIRLAHQYNSILAGNGRFVLPKVEFEEGLRPVFYRYTVRALDQNADGIRGLMKERNIICGHGVSNPLHRLLGLNQKEFPNAERLSREVISLPLYPSLTEEQVKHIAETFISVVAGYNAKPKEGLFT
jgi:perosamine synthetase